MLRKLSPALAIVTISLLATGLAWAVSDSPAPSPATAATQPDSTVATSPDSTDQTTPSSQPDVTVTTPDETATSITTPDETATSITTPDETATSITTPDETATSITTGPSGPEDATFTFPVPGAGSVTVAVLHGALVLEAVDPAAGWGHEIEKLEWDRIRIEFQRGDDEREIDIRIRGSEVEVEVDD